MAEFGEFRINQFGVAHQINAKKSFTKKITNYDFNHLNWTLKCCTICDEIERNWRSDLFDMEACVERTDAAAP